jgi:putative ABC transport system permease protein
VTKFALKSLFSRKLRSALTAIAIVLGVAMISGTYVLTDSISNAFDAIFTQSYRGTDAVISGKSAFDLSSNGLTTDPPFAASLLPEVKSLPDVKAAIGGVGGEAQLIGRNGKAIVFGGAPNLGFSVDPSQPDFNSLTLVAGRWPKNGEVVVDRSTAGKKDIAIGQEIGVQAEGPVVRLRVSGLVKFGGVSTIGGATLAGFNLETAQQLFHKAGKLDQIRVSAKSGVSGTELTSEINKILPAGTQVRSGNGQAASDAKDTNSFISFLQTFLLSFGGVALFVGAFVIANSLSITIAQRTREFATLRTLGASRRQVLRSVIIEALVVGVVASVAGLFLGLALGKGLFSLFDAVGFTLPNNGLTFQTRTVVVALLVGVLVTLLASLRPALRATRVPPIAAVREGATLPEGRLRRYRPIATGLVAVLGFAALIYGLFGASGTKGVLIWMGLGALLVFVGVSLWSSHIVVPLARVLGWPATRIGGAAGSLARDNARRNPQRTASTAAALMIGLALVTLVATLATSIIETFNSAVDDLAGGEFYAITAQNNFSPIPVAAGEAAAKTPGLESISDVRAGDMNIYGNTRTLTAVDPGIGKVITLTWKDGSQAVLANLGATGAFIDNNFADNHNLTNGSSIILLTPTGKTLTFTIKGIFKPPAGGSPFGPVTISTKTFDANYDEPKNIYSFVTMKGGVTDANTAALNKQLEGFPNAKVADGDQFKKNQVSGLKSVLNVLYVLLALSVLVSVFGIVNVLVLTVFERTREIGMLRAIGMTRRQVRRMIRHESVITSLIGAVIGCALGLVLAALLIARVDEINFFTPWGQLVIFLIAAIIVGIIAAIFPARRAAKLNPLEALQYE